MDIQGSFTIKMTMPKMVAKAVAAVNPSAKANSVSFLSVGLPTKLIVAQTMVSASP